MLLLAYNEEAAIGSCLERLKGLLATQSEPFRFVVVDDGSTDRTAEIVGGMAGSMPVTLLQHPKNLGVARGFDTGLRHIAESAAADDPVVTLEADNTNDPSYLLRMFGMLRSGFDVVCASRYRRGGSYIGFPLKRLLFSLGANWSMRLFFPVPGVRDFTIFFRVYRSRVLSNAIRFHGARFIERRGFTANAEILFKIAAAGPVRCGECPLAYRYDLKKSGSKMKVAHNVREYGSLFASLLKGPAGLPLRQSAAMLLLGAALGAWGIGWGLPSKPRLEPLLPGPLLSDAAFHRLLAASREELYVRMEANSRLPVDYVLRAEDFPAGWTLPSGRLLDSCRSFFLRSENADEQKNLTYLAHMRPRRLQFAPYAASYGGAFLYPLGGWYVLAASARLVRITSDLAYYVAEPARMAAVFETGRFFNALCSGAGAAVLAALGRCLAGAAGGWLAGLLFLLSPANTITAHTINPYLWATLWGAVMFLFLFRYLDRGEEGDLLKGAAAFGACFGSSIAFWALALAMPIACLLRAGSGAAWRAELRSLVKAALLSCAVFALTNPYLFFRFQDYKGELEYELYGFPFELTFLRLRDFLAGFLGFNMGLAASLTALGAALWQGVRRRAPAQSRLTAWTFLAGCFMLALRLADPAHGRHFLPFIALGCVLAADALMALSRSRWRPLGWVLAAAIFLENAPVSASYLWSMAREARGVSTRLAAGLWINEHLPPGRSIGLVAPPQPADTPPFRLDRYPLVLFAAPEQLAHHPLPDYVVISETRRSPALDAFLSSRYRILKSFEPERLFPWVPVRGLFTQVGARIDVLERVQPDYLRK